MILTAVYGLLTVFTLINALTASRTSSIRPAQTLLVPTPVPAATDVPFASYGTMGTSVPEEYYGGMTADDGSVDGLTETGFSGGSDDGSGDSGLYDESGTDENAPYVATVKSEAEIALENFMEKWRKGIVADMVEYTAKSWQDSLSDQPSQQLFWKFAQKPLVDWRQMAAPTGTDESNARTISIQADVNYGGKARTYQYDALVLCEDGKWAVDPDSLSTGVLVEAATPTPDPNVTPTPTPEPIANPAALISSFGTLKVNNVPAVSVSGKFTVYGTTSAYSIVTASVEIQLASAQPTATPQQLGFIASAVAENVQQTVRRTVGQAVADANGNYTMEVTLPQPGEYIVEFASGTSYANYGVTYDTGMTPEPTAQPMPTAEPIQEEGGMGILPIVIVVVLAVVAGAAIYGVYIYRRKSEEAEEEETDEDEDEEDEIRAEQLSQQRSRYAQPQTPGSAPKPQAPSGRLHLTCSGSTQCAARQRAVRFRRTIFSRDCSKNPFRSPKPGTSSAPRRRSSGIWSRRARWTVCSAATSASAKRRSRCVRP